MDRYRSMGFSEADNSKESHESEGFVYTKKEYLALFNFLDFLASYPLEKDVFLL